MSTGPVSTDKLPYEDTASSGLYYEQKAPAGAGLLTFAVAMMAFAGTWAIIEGIAAIADSRVFVANSVFVFSNLNTWGWIVLGLGALLLLAAVLGVHGQPVRPLVRHLRRRPERDRPVVLHPGLSALVDGDVRRGHHHHLRPRDVRRAEAEEELRALAVTASARRGGRDPGSSAGGGGSASTPLLCIELRGVARGSRTVSSRTEVGH